jgi:catechol 2,3-dioxygenase-like lactoylglutathione lyase family enzyme
MIVHHITPILNVSDVPASIEWFAKLGWGPHFTYNDGGMIAGAAPRNEHGPARFAGVGCGASEVFLCHDGQGSRGIAPSADLFKGLPAGQSPDDRTPGVWMSWWVGSPAEVDEAHERCTREGVFVVWPPTDQPWGVRELRIMHPDGHTFRISAHLKR